jgi:membrane-associated phospholipid phosphatase
VEVEAFGSEAPYVEVWRITDWCADNCSFVSGEASSAVWLVAVALVLPKSVRTPATIAATVYALLLSLNRIAFGGHFLSDVLISFGLTLLVIAVVHRAVIERPPNWLSNEALEAGLGRLGLALRRKRDGAGTA